MAVRSEIGVLLIGPRGVGKSTVGPLLAERLGVPFVDADAAVRGALADGDAGSTDDLIRRALAKR